MGMSAEAHLAYGYHLGTPDKPEILECDEDGYLNLPWLSEDADFGEGIEKRLLVAVGFTETYVRDGGRGYFARMREAWARVGVDLKYSGHVDYPGWVLVVEDSERSVEWMKVMALDPDEMERRPITEEWNAKLAWALAELGITPKQDGPKWLVYPSYG